LSLFFFSRSQRYRSARGTWREIKSVAETHSEKQTRFAAKFTCARREVAQKYVAAAAVLTLSARLQIEHARWHGKRKLQL
jgi:hypothetical protein